MICDNLMFYFAHNIRSLKKSNLIRKFMIDNKSVGGNRSAVKHRRRTGERRASKPQIALDIMIV